MFKLLTGSIIHYSFAIIKLHLCHTRLKYTWDASFNFLEVRVRVRVSLVLNKEEQKQANKKEKVTESLHLTVEMVESSKICCTSLM